MTDRRPFEDVLPTSDGFSIPDQKWHELLFIGALRREGEAFVRDPGRPLPPFRIPNLFPPGARFVPLAEAGRVRLRVERRPGMARAEEPFLAGRPLACRLEATEVAWARSLAAELDQLDPAVEAACERRAGGGAVFLGANSPLNRALGLGLGPEPSPSELEAIEVFFRSRGCTPRIAVSPFADLALLRFTGDRGYRVGGFENVLFRCLCPWERFSSDIAGTRVEASHQEKRTLWAETFLAASDQGSSPGAYRKALALFAVAEGGALLARRGDQPVGVAAWFLRERTALGFADAALPGFRHRGVQGAMIEARLARAVAAGCDLVMTVTEPGSSVQRNHERAGFRLAYTRVVLSAP